MTVGALTTHVLDLGRGRPAAGVAIKLARVDDQQIIEVIEEAVTNAHGRTDAPLATGSDFRAGTYELRFSVGEYVRAAYTSPETFLDIVPVRIDVIDPAPGFHVPLLVTPWSYSVYRGS